MKLILIAAMGAGIGLAGVRGPSVQEEMRWHGWVPGGQMVEINNVNGNVRAEPGFRRRN